MLRTVLSFIGTSLFVAVFGLCAFGGILGLLSIVGDWKSWAPDERQFPLLLGMLCALILAVGLIGMAKFLRPEMRRFEVDPEIQVLRRPPPLINVAIGLVVLAAGSAAMMFSRQLSKSNDGLYHVPVGVLAFGAAQVCLGLYQLTRFWSAREFR